MKKENFTFQTKDLSYSVIEEAVCNGVGLCFPQSSGLKHILSKGKTKANISALNGSVSCTLDIYKSVDGGYTVNVSNIDIEKK